MKRNLVLWSRLWWTEVLFSNLWACFQRETCSKTAQFKSLFALKTFCLGKATTSLSIHWNVNIQFHHNHSVSGMILNQSVEGFPTRSQTSFQVFTWQFDYELEIFYHAIADEGAGKLKHGIHFHIFLIHKDLQTSAKSIRHPDRLFVWCEHLHFYSLNAWDLQNTPQYENTNKYRLNKSKCILYMVYWRSFGSKLPISAGLKDSIFIRC